MFRREVLTRVLIILRTIWLVPASFVLTAGLIAFMGNANFGSWMAWGFMCCFVILPIFIRGIIEGARHGAVHGSNNYTATQVGSTIYIENHPILGAIGGIIGGIFISILFGPIYLIIRFISNLIYVIRGYIAIAHHQI